jgi:hypothetical protein
MGGRLRVPSARAGVCRERHWRAVYLGARTPVFACAGWSLRSFRRAPFGQDAAKSDVGTSSPSPGRLRRQLNLSPRHAVRMDGRSPRSASWSLTSAGRRAARANAWLVGQSRDPRLRSSATRADVWTGRTRPRRRRHRRDDELPPSGHARHPGHVSRALSMARGGEVMLVLAAAPSRLGERMLPLSSPWRGESGRHDSRGTRRSRLSRHACFKAPTMGDKSQLSSLGVNQRRIRTNRHLTSPATGRTLSRTLKLSFKLGVSRRGSE